MKQLSASYQTYSIVYHGVASPCSVCHILESCFGNMPISTVNCWSFFFQFRFVVYKICHIEYWLTRVLSVSMEKTMNMMPRSSCWTSICMQWRNHLTSSLWWCHRSLFLYWWVMRTLIYIDRAVHLYFLCSLLTLILFLHESSGACGRYKHWLWRYSQHSGNNSIYSRTLVIVVKQDAILNFHLFIKKKLPSALHGYPPTASVDL